MGLRGTVRNYSRINNRRRFVGNPTSAQAVVAAMLLMLSVSSCAAYMPAPQPTSFPSSQTAAPSKAAASAEEPAPASTPSKHDQTAAASNKDKELATWLEYVRDKTISFTDKSDEELTSIASGLCNRMRNGELYEEVAYDITSASYSKRYTSDMSLVFGTGIVDFCPEFDFPDLENGDAATLTRLREVAPSIAHNSDSAILSQARDACPAVSRGLAGGAATVQEARRAWGHDQGYRFIFISLLHNCGQYLNNVVASK